MSKIILLYINSSRWQMSCQMALIIRDSQLDSSLQTKCPGRILKHIGKWDSAFTFQRLGNGICKSISSTRKKVPAYVLCVGMMLGIGSAQDNSGFETGDGWWDACYWTCYPLLSSVLNTSSPQYENHSSVLAHLPEIHLFPSNLICHVLVRLVFSILSPSQNAANVLIANLTLVSFVWLLWLSSSYNAVPFFLGNLNFH